jgi:hypothetical protein
VVNELHVEDAAAPSAPTVELLSWLAMRTRTYDEAIDAWHSHCPQLTTWEDALIDGLIRIERTQGENSIVGLTDCGRAVLVRAERSGQT